MGYRLLTCIKDLICGGVIHTPKLTFFFMFVALKWLKTSIEILKWKFDSIWTSILHEIDVDLTPVCWKNTMRTKKNNSRNLRLESDLSITVCSWISFLKHISSVQLLQRVNYVTLHFLNKINVIKVVMVILELFKLDKHSRIIQEHFIPYIYLCW